MFIYCFISCQTHFVTVCIPSIMVQWPLSVITEQWKLFKFIFSCILLTKHRKYDLILKLTFLHFNTEKIIKLSQVSVNNKKVSLRFCSILRGQTSQHQVSTIIITNWIFISQFLSESAQFCLLTPLGKWKMLFFPDFKQKYWKYHYKLRWVHKFEINVCPVGVVRPTKQSFII